MIDQSSFWMGVLTGFIGFIAAGLALGAIHFEVTVRRKGVEVKDVGKR